MNFTLFDLIILTIITICSMAGMLRGLLKLTISMVGFLVSIIVTYLIYPFVQKFLVEFFLLNNEVIIVILTTIIAYISSSIMVHFVTSKILILIGSISGGFIDRLLGLVAGFILGSIISLVLFIIIMIFASGSYIKAETANDILITQVSEDKHPEWFKRSLTVKYLDNAGKKIIRLVPEDALKSIKLPKETKVNNSMDELTKTVREKKESSEADSHIKNEDLERELDDLLAK